ncbi:structural maintenance of chromosomes protein 6-like [Stegostoma tigrinum]|uniref:structural maintenance of chromosomes protein 6-like n=1 Tax=Stegostoma tigrinum TaxID=3053191 RepID=UPI00286FE077|nr:structural maintenance of chromosomes protein 6-like [Stegostoma tigrinum]
MTGDLIKNACQVGIIESILLKNFMCHSSLKLSFGPHFNFVSGNNGSSIPENAVHSVLLESISLKVEFEDRGGKSALLTAIIIGLGGRAAATNRGPSTKEFVKTGQNSACISITLRNQGPDAFKPELYGKAIVVEQTISAQGTRQYSLKSESEHIISTKKEELNMILEQFNIQVDNPVSILNQEMSKLLLKSKSGPEKYKFFMKATRLDQMQEDYSQILRTKTITRERIAEQDDYLAELKKKVKEKERHYKSLEPLNGLQEKLEQLKNQMAWALVIEIEKDLESIKDCLNREQQHGIKYNHELEEWQAKVNFAELKFKAAQDQLQKITEEKEQLQRQLLTLKENMTRKKKGCKESEATVHLCKSQLKQLQKDHDLLQRQLEELSRGCQSSKANFTELKDGINNLQEQLKPLKQEEATTLKQIENYYDTISNLKDEQDNLRHEEQAMRNTVQSKRSELGKLKASRTDCLKRFNGNMPELLRKIEEAHKQGRFRKRPIGPLGVCFRLKYPQLALAVESCLRGLLLSFCCDNYRDEQVLQSLMSQCFHSGRRPQINVCEFSNQVYNIKDRAVRHPDFPTVFECLEISNPVVANCFIDLRSIERILIIKSNSRAREIMQQQRPPANCREAFTAAGDQVFPNRYYSSETDRARYLGGDVESKIRELEVELNEKIEQLSLNQKRSDLIKNKIELSYSNINKAHMKRRQIQGRITKIELEFGDLENIEEPQPFHIPTLRKETRDIYHRILSAKTNLEQARKDMDEHRKLMDEDEKKWKEMREKKHSIAEEIDSRKEELSKMDTEIEVYKQKEKHLEEERNKHLERIDKLKKSLETKENTLERDTAKARQICVQRLEVSRDPKSIDVEINCLRERINMAQEVHGNKEEITRQYFEILKLQKNIQDGIKRLKNFMQMIDKIMKERHKAYESFLKSMSIRCKLNFSTLLSKQQYYGMIKFDHKNRDLSIMVECGEGMKTTQGDTRLLSGGERSFSTVCFILSLWDTIESPFCCLDEFDVYMDMVNRRISIDLILRVADSIKCDQFFFFTPLTTSFLPQGNQLRILHLQDPERGQTTRSFATPEEPEDSDN